MTSAPARRVGRPPVVAERRAQLVGAFIELVARDGLEHVTLDAVAAAAGVRRSAVNHFIGNREDLVVAAVDELRDRYIKIQREAAGPEPGIEEIIDLMFGEAWILDFSTEDAAFDALLGESVRNPRTRAIIKGGYDVLISEITEALRRSYPDATAAAARDTGYAIACLIEQNITFQQLGYPRARIRGAKQAALFLAAQLGAPDR